MDKEIEAPEHYRNIDNCFQCRWLFYPHDDGDGYLCQKHLHKVVYAKKRICNDFERDEP